MRRARRNFLCFAALCLSVLAEDDVEEENRVLKLRLQALQQELAKEGDEMQYSYLVVKGMIADAESVYMETMDIDEAKLDEWRGIAGVPAGGNPDERSGVGDGSCGTRSRIVPWALAGAAACATRRSH